MEEHNVEETIETTVDETVETSVQETQMAEEKKPDADLEAKNKELFARAKKAEEDLKRFKSQKVPEKGVDGEWKNKVEFLIKNRDYNEEEFDHISTVAARKGISYDEAAKAEIEYINFRRQKVINENKTPSPSGAGFGSFEKKIDSGTSKEDAEKILKERFEKAQANQNTGY